MDDNSIIIELVKVAVPVVTTLVTSLVSLKMSIRHAAKQSILQMIMEDEFSWEIYRKFPVNYGNIMDEYAVYHKAGGNGEVTKKVEEYKAWYTRNEQEMQNMRSTTCTPRVILTCEADDKKEQ